MSTTTWRPILGWEGLYEINTFGAVRSLPRVCSRGISYDGKLVRSFRSSGGYYFLNLSGAGKRQKRSVHTLVAEAFFGARPEGKVCRHLDGNPANNRVENLAWGSYAENNEDAKRHGTYRKAAGENHVKAKLKVRDVIEIRRLVAEGETQRRIASRYGVTQSAISGIISRRCWAHV